MLLEEEQLNLEDNFSSLKKKYKNNMNCLNKYNLSGDGL